GATYMLPRLVGVDKALELMFTGDIIDAKEAERIGLVTKVVPHNDLTTVSEELAAKIAKGPPVATELAKKAVYRSLETSLDSQLDFERYLISLCLETEDFKEALKAFQDKRTAQFKGR
ncbi:enoyl-CoA hydratase/isomerase family protein, partial [Chloroflexota bacterium]